MSDKLVSLEEVITAINKGFLTRAELRRRIMSISPAPHEMTAMEYLKTYDRFVDWCTSQLCSCCKYHYRHNSCLMRLGNTPEQKITDIQKWAREHPEEEINK